MARHTVLVAGLLAAMAGSAHAQFVDFGLWNRYVDWQSDTETGPTGTVWEYGVVDATAGDAWYADSSVSSLSWSGGDDPASGSWAHNGRPVFSRSGMNAASDGTSPWVGWNNPAGDGTSVDIDGKVRIQTSGTTPSGEQSVEFVIAKRAADGSFQELHRARISGQDLASMGGAGMVMPVSLSNVTVNDGESIVLSSRVLGSGEDAATVQLIDDISIAVDPPVQTGKILEAAFNRPFNPGSPGGVRSGGGSGGGGGLLPGDQSLPPFPTEAIRNDAPVDDSSRSPMIIPTPGSVVVLTMLGGLSAMRRRR